MRCNNGSTNSRDRNVSYQSITQSNFCNLNTFRFWLSAANAINIICLSILKRPIFMIVPAITARPRKRFRTQYSPDIFAIRRKNRDITRTAMALISSIEGNVVEHIALLIIRLHLNPHSLTSLANRTADSRKFRLLVTVERLYVALIIITRIMSFV